MSTMRYPSRSPGPVGPRVTSNVQLAPGPSSCGQSLRKDQSCQLKPSITAPARRSCSTAHVFLSRMTCGALDVPMVWNPKDAGRSKLKQPGARVALSRTSNEVVVATVREQPDADSVYQPAMSMLRSRNVATPFTAATVTVPDRVAPVGPVAIATVTSMVEFVTTLPESSRIDTWKAGLIVCFVSSQG